MRCPNCDFPMHDRKCPYCGYSASGTPKGRFVTIAIVAIAVVALLAVIQTYDSPDRSSPDDHPPTNPGYDPTYPSNETNSFEMTGFTVSGTYSDLFTVTETVDEDGNTVLGIALDVSRTGEAKSYSWSVYKEGHSYDRYTESSTVPEFDWTLDDTVIGNYVIEVMCYLGQTGPWQQYAQYDILITVSGEVTKTYTWIYDWKRHSMSIGFDYSEFQRYSGTAGATMLERAAYGNGSYQAVQKFLVLNGTVTTMEEQLSDMYERTYGTKAEGQSYAEFILAFVQECYSYSLDIKTYGRDEYYAFPMETIYHGTGDCEDTSILCAVLLSAAGYDAGVFMIPGHAIAAVSLESYMPGKVAYAYAMSVDMFRYGTYYGCETTLDDNSYGIGWIDDSYSIYPDGTVYHNGTAHRDYPYGLYTVTG